MENETLGIAYGILKMPKSLGVGMLFSMNIMCTKITCMHKKPKDAGDEYMELEENEQQSRTASNDNLQ